MAPALVGVSPLLVLLFAWSYFTIPREIFDLAREAGLGPLRTWWYVAVPLRMDAAVSPSAVAFMVSWGNFLDPLLYVYDERWFTLPLGLASLAELPPTDQGLMLAAAVFAIAPVLVTAFVAQRFVYYQEVVMRGRPQLRPALVAVFVMIAVACGSGSGDQGTRITVMVSGDPEEIEAYRSVVDAFDAVAG